jgi:hypothetical protein
MTGLAARLGKHRETFPLVTRGSILDGFRGKPGNDGVVMGFAALNPSYSSGRRATERPALHPGLDPGPEPVHQPRGADVMRVDSIEPRHDRVVGIDGAVVDDRGVDQGLAGEIAIGI